MAVKETVMIEPTEEQRQTVRSEPLKELGAEAEDKALQEALLRSSHESAVACMKENPY
jgi:hypothetical protein